MLVTGVQTWALPILHAINYILQPAPCKLGPERSPITVGCSSGGRRSRRGRGYGGWLGVAIRGVASLEEGKGGERRVGSERERKVVSEGCSVTYRS